MTVHISDIEKTVHQIREGNPDAKVTVMLTRKNKVIHVVQFYVSGAFIKSGKFAAHVRNALKFDVHHADSFRMYVNEGEWA